MSMLNIKLNTKSKWLVFFLLLFSDPVLAKLIYVKGQLGMSVTTDGSIDGTDVNTKLAAPYPITLGLGVYVTSVSSLALELNYETTKIDELPPSITAIGSDTQTQVSAMLSYYYHTPKLFILEPFVGAGAGYTQLKIQKNDFEGESFTWQATVGTDISYSDSLQFVIEGRVFKPVDIQLTDENNVDVGEFNTTQIKLLAGIKLKF